MNKSVNETVSKNVRYRIQMSASERRESSVLLALIFAVGLCGTLLLTLGGVHALLELVRAAHDFKSSVVASVLGLGLVMLGPVLLLALAVILPRWWFDDMKNRIKKLFRHHAHSADS